MNTSRYFTPAQLAEGRRNAAAALLHRRAGDHEAAFKTLTTGSSFAAAVNGLLDITAALIGPSAETTEFLQDLALNNDQWVSYFDQLERGNDDD